MLRGNLSTRPFYNERLATLAIVLFAVAALALTIFNATELMRLSAERRETLARVERDQAEASKIRIETATLQKSVDRALLAQLAGDTHEANEIIDQRMFSWTGFFSIIEKTLPMDVRLIMVSPRLERGVFRVAITVVAKSLVDVGDFTDALGGSGAFYDVVASDRAGREDGTFRATIEASYLQAPVQAGSEQGQTGVRQGSDRGQTPPQPERKP